jgi:DMSO/TMAO reductase YedYZ heme-binding membrane subunit
MSRLAGAIRSEEQMEASKTAAAEKSRRQKQEAMRSGWGVLAAGIVSTGALYGVLAYLQSRGTSAAVLNMPEIKDVGKYWVFPMLQASGITGLVFAYASMVLGLRQSKRAGSRSFLSYQQVDRLHRQISLLVIGLVLVHVVATVYDAMENNWETVLVPGHIASQEWPEAVTGFNTGIFATYIMLLVAPTFYLRGRLGVKNWRFVHRFVIAFYVLSVWHTLVLKLDVGHYAWAQPLIWIAQIPLLALLVVRLRDPLRGSAGLGRLARRGVELSRHTLVSGSIVAIVLIIAIVVTGNSGFIETV